MAAPSEIIAEETYLCSDYSVFEQSNFLKPKEKQVLIE